MILLFFNTFSTVAFIRMLLTDINFFRKKTPPSKRKEESRNLYLSESLPQELAPD
jgi:hypothetical protein